jgi:metallo-beta-lactamase family protein
MIELAAAQNDVSRRVIFSGDMGQPGKPFVRNPQRFTDADQIVMESTYGDRSHGDHDTIERQLADVIRRTAAAGGKVVIPVFAIERAQELIYYLGRLVRAGRIPSLPVFLDSPMAAEVNEVFRRHRDVMDPEMLRRMASGETLLGFPGLVTVHSVAQSKALNHRKGPAVIMATNGMCSAGRIKHHLAQYIDRPECAILFVGYQARGTLGRQLLDGAREVRLHGRARLVRAAVEHIAGLSGHADRESLLAWLRHFSHPPRQLFLTHGEEQSSLALADEIRRDLGWTVIVPEYRQVVELC